MATTFDAAEFTDILSGTTGTHSAFTLGGGSNRAVLACIGWEDAADSLSSVTFNGTGMTFLVAPADNGYNAEIYYMLEASLPAAGDYDIVATFSGDIARATVGGISVSGADQTVGNWITGSNEITDAGHTTVAITLTSAPANSMIITTYANKGPTTRSINDDQGFTNTSRWNTTIESSAAFAASTTPVTATATTVMTATHANSTSTALSGVAIPEAAGGSAVPIIYQMLAGC